MTQHESFAKDRFRGWVIANNPELYEEWVESPAEWMDLPEWVMAMHPEVREEYLNREVL